MKEHLSRFRIFARVLAVIFVLLAVCCAIYFVTVVMYAGLDTSFAFIWMVFVVVFLLMAYYTARSSVRTGGLPKFVPTFIFTSFALGALIFILIMSAVVRDSRGVREDTDFDYCIVPGAKVYANGISVTLKNRLDTAYQFLSAHENAKVVLSGGKEPQDAVAEAVAMFNYLSLLGVPSGRMIIDTSGTTTADILEGAVLRIEEDVALRNIAPPGGPGTNGGAGPAREPDPGESRFSEAESALSGGDVRIGVITSDYHLLRCLKVLEALRIYEPGGIPAESDRVLFVHQCVRESAAIVKDLLMGHFVFEKGDLPFELPFANKEPGRRASR